jgi:hypothetical protein
MIDNDPTQAAVIAHLRAEQQGRFAQAWRPFFAKWMPQLQSEERDRVHGAIYRTAKKYGPCEGFPPPEADLESLYPLFVQQAARHAGSFAMEARWGLITLSGLGLALLFNNHPYIGPDGYAVRDRETARFLQRLEEGVEGARYEVKALAYAEDKKPGEEHGYSFALLLRMDWLDYDAVHAAYEAVRGKTLRELLAAQP